MKTGISQMYINEARNQLAEKSFDVVLNYLKKNPKLGVKVAVKRVTINGTDERSILESTIFPVCDAYNETVSEGKPPHLVLDSTMDSIPSEVVKMFTNALALPTISSSFGQKGDLRQWNTLDNEKQKYLIQINSPADIIPEIVKTIVYFQRITNARILYDDSFGGVFIVIFIGIDLACLTLVFEYWWNKYKRPTNAVNPIAVKPSIGGGNMEKLSVSGLKIFNHPTFRSRRGNFGEPHPSQ